MELQRTEFFPDCFDMTVWITLTDRWEFHESPPDDGIEAVQTAASAACGYGGSGPHQGFHHIGINFLTAFFPVGTHDFCLVLVRNRYIQADQG